jgi:hypothetical protein
MRTGIVIVSFVAGAGALQGTIHLPEMPTGRTVEVARLQAHFDSVDAELRSRSVASLSSEQQVKRAQMISWLRDYRKAAEFPVNDRFAEPTPVFRDAQGALCAMGYLIERSGRGDIVDKVEATRNYAYIPDLADDPALVAWLDSAGLSVAEAARIQPAYESWPIPTEPYPVRRGVDGDFALAAVGLGSLSLASTAVNLVKPGYVSGLAGIFAGAASIGAAAHNFSKNRPTDRVAAATLSLGTLSLGAGVYGLLEARRSDRDPDRDHRGRRGKNRFSLQVLPDVVVQNSEPALGMRVTGKF